MIMMDIDVLCHCLSTGNISQEQAAELVQVLYRLLPTHLVAMHYLPDRPVWFTAEEREQTSQDRK